MANNTPLLTEYLKTASELEHMKAQMNSVSDLLEGKLKASDKPVFDISYVLNDFWDFFRSDRRYSAAAYVFADLVIWGYISYLANDIFSWGLTGFPAIKLVLRFFAVGNAVLFLFLLIYDHIEYRKAVKDYNVFYAKLCSLSSGLDIAQLRERYSRACALTERIYSIGAIEQQYMNEASVTALYGYFKDGKCGGLSGSGEAYSLLRADIHSGRVKTESGAPPDIPRLTADEYIAETDKRLAECEKLIGKFEWQKHLLTGKHPYI